MARTVVTPLSKASKFEGLPELVAKLNELRVRGKGAEAKKVFLNAAMVLVKELRLRAEWKHVREAVFAGSGKQTEPNVLVGINFRKAPDVYWLEYGTGYATDERAATDARRPKKATFLKFQINGKWIYVKKVANLKPKPFFRPAVEAKRKEVAAVMAEGFRRMLEEMAVA